MAQFNPFSFTVLQFLEDVAAKAGCRMENFELVGDDTIIATFSRYIDRPAPPVNKNTRQVLPRLVAVSFVLDIAANPNGVAGQVRAALNVEENRWSKS